MDCCVVLFRVYGCRLIFCVDTSVDFSTVQVTYTIQLHGFSVADCRKSRFNSIPAAILRNLRYSSTVTHLMDCRNSHFNPNPDAVLVWKR